MSEMSYQDWRKKEAKAVSKMKIKFGGILNDEEKDLKDRVGLDVHRIAHEFIHSHYPQSIMTYQYIRNRLYAVLSDYCREKGDQISERYVDLPELMHDFKSNSIDKELHG